MLVRISFISRPFLSTCCLFSFWFRREEVREIKHLSIVILREGGRIERFFFNESEIFYFSIFLQVQPSPIVFPPNQHFRWFFSKDSLRMCPIPSSVICLHVLFDCFEIERSLRFCLKYDSRNLVQVVSKVKDSYEHAMSLISVIASKRVRSDVDIAPIFDWGWLLLHLHSKTSTKPARGSLRDLSPAHILLDCGYALCVSC